MENGFKQKRQERAQKSSTTEMKEHMVKGQRGAALGIYSFHKQNPMKGLDKMVQWCSSKIWAKDWLCQSTCWGTQEMVIRCMWNAVVGLRN